MKIKTSLAVLSLLSISELSAGEQTLKGSVTSDSPWTANGYHNMVWYYFEGGKHYPIGIAIPVNLTPQLNTYSCGAANAYMFVDWSYTIENNYNMTKTVFTPLASIEAFYLAMDKDGQKGLNTEEFKSGLSWISNNLNLRYQLVEGSASSVEDAGSIMFNVLSSTSHPIILYSNIYNNETKRPETAGGHYRLLKSVTRWKGKYIFLINDPMYSSPSYIKSKYDIIKPDSWVTAYDLENKFWLKVGSALPLLKKHMFLYPTMR